MDEPSNVDNALFSDQFYHLEPDMHLEAQVQQQTIATSYYIVDFPDLRYIIVHIFKVDAQVMNHFNSLYHVAFDREE